jgi:hypothetical protein
MAEQNQGGNVYYPQLREASVELQEAVKYLVDLVSQQAGQIRALEARLAAGGL